jgi:hypothetical protein
MESKSHQVAAIVAELEEETASLRKHIEYLRGVMDKGMAAVMALESGVLVPLPPPKELAFGQRWALVFTIGPNYPSKPSLGDLFCRLEQPGGKSEGYLPINDMPFGPDELPEYALYLGMGSWKPVDRD